MSEKQAGAGGAPMLATVPINRLIWKFAIPGIISQVMSAVYNIVDQIFIGWGVGDLGIAAANIALPLSTLITALSALFGMGGAARFNLAVGQKKITDAKQSIGTSMLLMVIGGTVICVLSSLFLQPMLYAFGSTDEIMLYAKPYARIISIGIPFGIFATGASYLIRADGNPNFSMAILLSGSIFNLIADPIFLYGFHMGIQGIALATTLGQMLSAAMAFYYMRKKFHTVSLEKGDFKLHLDVVKSICTFGSAVFFTHVCMTLVQIVQSNAMRYYGALSVYGSETALAAVGAVSKVMVLLMSTIIGISLGCQPIYSFNYGNKTYGRVKETYLLAIKYTTVVSTVAFFCIQLFPRQILHLFGSGNPLFYDFASQYMRIYLFMTFANALLPVSSNFFSSIGKAKRGLYLTLLKQLVLLIPLLLILPHFFGIHGVLFAGPISDGVTAALVVILGIREVRALDRLEQENPIAS